MSLRPPSRFSGSASPGRSIHGDGLNPLDHEIASEMAAALGRAGEAVERSLRLLRSVDRESPERAALLKAACDAVYGYFVQRELCGLRRHGDVIRDYAIPGEVLARLGAS